MSYLIIFSSSTQLHLFDMFLDFLHEPQMLVLLFACFPRAYELAKIGDYGFLVVNDRRNYVQLIKNIADISYEVDVVFNAEPFIEIFALNVVMLVYLV